MSYHARKVLVTGADGFIGSHLVEALVEQGAEVRAFCLYNSTGSLGWLDRAAPAVRHAIEPRLGDVRDARYVETSMEGIEVVFHLAALVAIPYSYQAPASFVDTNIGGTLHVLEGARRSGVARVVHTSTSEVYGTPATLPIRETHPLQGQSPYSASKIGADKLAEAYACSFDLPVVTVRPFNTYGPRQSARAVIPTILTQLLAGQRRVRLGNLEPRRDLTFVSDTVDGFLRAGLAAGLEGETVQLGTGRSESVLEVFRAACTACGVEAEPEVEVQRLRPAASEVMVLQSDPGRARDRLGWVARITLEDGLRYTADWLRGYLDQYRPGSYAV